MDVGGGVELESTEAARRELRVGSATVVVGVGIPQPVDGGASWLCPLYVEGPDGRVDLFAGGVDSMQALMSALVAVGDYVAAHFSAADVTWLGRKHHGLIQTEAGSEPGFHVTKSRFPTS